MPLTPRTTVQVVSLAAGRGDLHHFAVDENVERTGADGEARGGSHINQRVAGGGDGAGQRRFPLRLIHLGVHALLTGGVACPNHDGVAVGVRSNGFGALRGVPANATTLREVRRGRGAADAALDRPGCVVRAAGRGDRHRFAVNDDVERQAARGECRGGGHRNHGDACGEDGARQGGCRRQRGPRRTGDLRLRAGRGQQVETAGDGVALGRVAGASQRIAGDVPGSEFKAVI